MNYDPNIHWADHHCEVTLAQFQYSRTFNVSISGNCKGASILEAAIAEVANLVMQKLDNDESIILSHGKRGLELDRSSISSETEVERMVVCARIVKIVPKKPKN